MEKSRIKTVQEWRNKQFASIFADKAVKVSELEILISNLQKNNVSKIFLAFRRDTDLKKEFSPLTIEVDKETFSQIDPKLSLHEIEFDGLFQ